MTKIQIFHHEKIANQTSPLQSKGTVSLDPGLINTVSTVSKKLLSTHENIGKRSSPKTNKPDYAAKHLVSGEELTPFFAYSNTQAPIAYAPALVALAVITVFIITKMGAPAIDRQFPIDLKNVQLSSLNINQLLEIRENNLK